MEPKKTDWQHFVWFIVAMGAGYLIFSFFR